jgi:hypothetical protein
MTRKEQLTPIEDALAEQPPVFAQEVSSDCPSQGTKLSLETLLAETPENNIDEAWEKMAAVGRES